MTSSKESYNVGIGDGHGRRKCGNNWELRGHNSSCLPRIVCFRGWFVRARSYSVRLEIIWHITHLRNNPTECHRKDIYYHGSRAPSHVIKTDADWLRKYCPNFWPIISGLVICISPCWNPTPSLRGTVVICASYYTKPFAACFPFTHPRLLYAHTADKR